MGLFDHFNKFFAEPVATTKSQNLYNELGSSGTKNYHGYITQDYNTKFHGQRAVEIFEQMRTADSTINAILSALKLPILGAEASIESADPNDDKQNEIAEFVRQNLFENMEGGFKRHLSEALGSLDFGFYVFEKVYMIKDGKIWLKKLSSRLPSTISQWAMNSKPNEPGITQFLPYQTDGKSINPEIPMSKLVIYTNKKEGDNYEGVSIIRSAYKNWYFKDLLYKIDGIKHERGAGILVIGLPKGSADSDKADARELGENFKINESAYIIKPSTDWTVELMTNGIQTGDALIKSIEHHDVSITMSVLAEFLKLGSGSGSGGSYGLSKDKTSFFTMSLQSISKDIANTINEQFIKELVDLNYGKQEMYPYLTFQKIGEIDQAIVSEVVERLINAGLVKNDPAMRVWVHKTFGLPELTLEEAEEQQKEEDQNPKEPPKSGSKQEDPENKTEDIKAAEKIKRNLTLAEKRVKFGDLSTFFDENGKKVDDFLNSVTETQKKSILDKFSKAVSDGDILAISAFALPSDSSLKNNLRQIAKDAYEEGKRTASNEVGDVLPTTPPIDNKLRNARVDIAVDSRSMEIEQNIKTKALDLITKGVGTTAIIFELNKLFDKIVKFENMDLSGQIVENNINMGRNLVFNTYQHDIHGLQRSELLDNVTCPMCLSLDGRVLDSTDPFTKIGRIHNNCRGIWVSILKTDSELPVIKQLPKSVLSRFETSDGVPNTNAFKQLPKPIIKKDSRLQQKIDDGTIDNPNI